MSCPAVKLRAGVEVLVIDELIIRLPVAFKDSCPPVAIFVTGALAMISEAALIVRLNDGDGICNIEAIVIVPLPVNPDDDEEIVTLHSPKFVTRVFPIVGVAEMIMTALLALGTW